MSHLRLVPPLPADAPAETAERAPWHDPKVAVLFFEAASGLCLCRPCSMRRHPSYEAR